MSRPAPGAYRFDLGKNMTGWSASCPAGCSAGKTITRHAEILNPTARAHRQLRAPKCTDDTRGRRREKRLTPRFTFPRFSVVNDRPARKTELKADAVTGVVLLPTRAAGPVRMFPPMINQLQHNIVWGQRGNFWKSPTARAQRAARWTATPRCSYATACKHGRIRAFSTSGCRTWPTRRRKSASSRWSLPTSCSPTTGRRRRTCGPTRASSALDVLSCYGDRRILQRHYGRWPGTIRF